LPRSLIIGDARVGASRPASIRLSDREFAERLRVRAHDAWEVLFERHYDRVYRYALVKAGNVQVAEDVASITFQRALDGIEKYAYTGRPILAWLYGIASNVVKEEARASRRRQGNGMLSSIRSLVAGSSSDAGDTDGIAGWLDFCQALKGLTDLQREVIILRYVSGLSASETARAISRPETAVYALQSRAVAALRRKLR
jgi:RNA polymerase sigma-70 factor (ECF subfamily)